MGQSTLCNNHHRLIYMVCVRKGGYYSSGNLGDLLLQIRSNWSVLEPSLCIEPSDSLLQICSNWSVLEPSLCLEPSIVSLLITSSHWTSVESLIHREEDSSLSCRHAGLRTGHWHFFEMWTCTMITNFTPDQKPSKVRAHFIQAYWALDTLPPSIINCWY